MEDWRWCKCSRYAWTDHGQIPAWFVRIFPSSPASIKWRYWILKRPLEVCANLAMQTAVANLGPPWPTKNSQRITKNPHIFMPYDGCQVFYIRWVIRYRYSRYIMFYLGGYKTTLFRAQVSPCSSSLHTLAALSRADLLARKSGGCSCLGILQIHDLVAGTMLPPIGHTVTSFINLAHCFFFSVSEQELKAWCSMCAAAFPQFPWSVRLCTWQNHGHMRFATSTGCEGWPNSRISIYMYIDYRLLYF